MGKYTGKSYRPSNGTEGMCFDAMFCGCCIHEKFYHTQKHGDKQCDIYSDAILYEIGETKYPKEWVYDENDNPICTAHVKFDWGGDDGEFNEPPPPPEPDNPNQMVMPFILDEMEYKKEKQHELQT